MKLAKNLELPTAAVTQTFAFLGKRGGGKTYAATKLAEEMLKIRAQVIVLDVVGVWYGLRVPKKKKGTAFEITVFGGLNGDIEINPKAGKIVAGIILERNISAVVDISQFVQSEQMRFAYDFLITLFEGRKTRPGACHVFMEEAQELVPQNVPKSDGAFGARMLNAGERLVKLGRNFGIGCSLISQRPQEVNKKVLNQTEVLLAFQMTGIQERDTIKDWVKDKGDDTDVKQLLPKLETGEALIWSPTWLKISGTYKIAEKVTADVSATPEVGSTELRSNVLAPVDVAELRESIEALTTEMEANTPAALKKRIGELEKELNDTKRAISETKQPVTETITVEKPVFPPGLKEDLRTYVRQHLSVTRDELARMVTAISGALDLAENNLEKLINEKYANLSMAAENSGSRKVPVHNLDFRDSEGVRKTLEKLGSNIVEAPDMRIAMVKHYGTVGEDPRPKKDNVASFSRTNTSLSRPQQKLLDVLASFEPLGLTSLARSNLAVFADVSPKSSAFQNNLGALRNTSGSLGPEALIEYLPGSQVRLTDAGRAIADGNQFSASTNEDLLRAWSNKLSGPQSRILEALFRIYPESVSRPDLANAVGVSSNSSAYQNNLGSLRSLGLIDYGPGKTVFATNLLFPFNR